jgi:hypothetical protein
MKGHARTHCCWKCTINRRPTHWSGPPSRDRRGRCDKLVTGWNEGLIKPTRVWREPRTTDLRLPMMPGYSTIVSWPSAVVPYAPAQQGNTKIPMDGHRGLYTCMTILCWLVASSLPAAASLSRPCRTGNPEGYIGQRTPVEAARPHAFRGLQDGGLALRLQLRRFQRHHAH